jgi:hypothetical protein
MWPVIALCALPCRLPSVFGGEPDFAAKENWKLKSRLSKRKRGQSLQIESNRRSGNSMVEGVVVLDEMGQSIGKPCVLQPFQSGFMSKRWRLCDSQLANLVSSTAHPDPCSNISCAWLAWKNAGWKSMPLPFRMVTVTPGAMCVS